MEAWMHDREKALITKHLTKDKVMLEWGSGGSTLEFSKQVKEYYSIEHNKEWYDKVKNELDNQHITNVNYNYIPETVQRPANSGQSQYYQYKEYLDIVDTFDTKFDIVLIDGRARRLCAKKIIPYLNPGAIVIVHDWVLRHVYHCITDYYDVLEYVSDTPQTIATFTLRDIPKPNAYDLSLGSWERCTENYFYQTREPMKISLIQPSRNNLKYLKWSYDSIRKNQGNHEVEICIADDASTDGTWEWCKQMMEEDHHFRAILNNTGKRLGHTILYDRLINEVATHDICMIYHADMYLCAGALDAIKKEIKPRTIVSLTRIEPPLHPEGPEKVLKDFGVEPEEFKEEELLKFIANMDSSQNTTEGIFAPWAFYREDFQKIGGHDPLYAPQSKEDSDIFNRFMLDGVSFIQTWKGFVYHMTCRGSRRNTVDKAKNIYEDSPEWLAQNQRSTRNFIRKWGHFVKHDSLMKPIVSPKYNIAFVLKNGGEPLVEILEPWCDRIYTDCYFSSYIEKEQPNTKFDLSKRVLTIDRNDPVAENDIVVEIDGRLFNEQDYAIIRQLSEIIKDSGEIGTFELSNLKVIITQMNTYEKNLIVCNSTS